PFVKSDTVVWDESRRWTLFVRTAACAVGVVSVLCRSARYIASESAQRQCAECQTKVSQRDVAILRRRPQVCDNPRKPGADDVRAPFRLCGDEQAGTHLDEADGLHKGVTLDWKFFCHTIGEIAIPVSELVGELVEARDHRRGDEAGVQQAIGIAL